MASAGRHVPAPLACYDSPVVDAALSGPFDQVHQVPSITAVSCIDSLDRGTPYCLESARYLELRRLVRRRDLLQKIPSYYCGKILLNLGLLCCGLVLLATTTNSCLHMCVAVFLAFVFTQMGFIVHDAGHFQIFRQRWMNDLVGILHANLVLGFSYTRWVTTHNQHHTHPNQLGRDPDTDFPVLAFTQSQALAKTGFRRWIIARQRYFFFPLLLLEAVNLKVDCIRFLLRENVQYRIVELICLVAHFSLYFGFLFYCLSAAQAVLFVVVHQALFGLYLGMAIAPNHIGMPVLDYQTELDFLTRQALTTRNLRRHWLTDYVYGPLSCQIEHHLFPAIPVRTLRKAQAVVRPYFEAHGIPYHEVGPVESYREILHSLHEVSASSK